MIFASDLDRTLIYSPQAFDDRETSTVKVVEYKDNEIISYMTEKAINQLRLLSDQLVFVPVTTRTIEQFRRINFYQYKINVQYAVVSNGGNVLINNQVDVNWLKLILQRIEDNCLSFEDVIKRFSEISHPSWVRTSRIADNLFFYSVIELDSRPVEELASFELWLRENNWEMSLQGRKIYLTPSCVNKWDAVAYLKTLIGEDKVVAAGDSLLDVCLVKNADYGVCPAHGEIYQSFNQGKALGFQPNFTSQSSILASEEILAYVRSQVDSLERIAE